LRTVRMHGTLAEALVSRQTHRITSPLVWHVRRPVRMAPDRHHAQLAEALAALHGPGARLRRRAQPAAGASAEASALTPITSTTRTATFRNSHRDKQQTHDV
jgi:hypothetical protein